jgi:hypothetical protein
MLHIALCKGRNIINLSKTDSLYQLRLASITKPRLYNGNIEKRRDLLLFCDNRQR